MVLSGPAHGTQRLTLTKHGEEEALEAPRRSQRKPVRSGPVQSPHASPQDVRNCRFSDVAVIDPETPGVGLRRRQRTNSVQVREEHPGWTIWKGPFPTAKLLEQLGARAKRVAERLRSHGRPVPRLFPRTLPARTDSGVAPLASRYRSEFRICRPPRFAFSAKHAGLSGNSRSWNYRTKLGIRYLTLRTCS